MRTLAGLRSHLLLALAGASACARQGPVEARPEPVGHERQSSGEPRFAEPPPDRPATPESCPYPVTQYCFAPGDLPKLLASCGAPNKQSDANGCMTRDSYASCGANVVSGPRLERGQCCYDVCQRPALPGGRPLSTAEGQRRAEAVDGPSWLLAQAANADDDFDDRVRAALAVAWTEDALSEHASVASFARFTLELLALGAPPELLSGAQRGALDEIEHARLCFGLASRFSGRALGPGPLELDGVAPRKTVREVALANAVEGCVAETFGASLALHQLEVCSDRETREVLTRIASDEADHAALAWRFLGWALSGAPELGDEVRRVVDAEVARWTGARGVGPVVDVEVWHRFGRLSPGDVAETVALSAREVIVPCLEQALGPSREPHLCDERAVRQSPPQGPLRSA